MAINLDQEKPLSLREAAKLPALQKNGRRPHISALYRWSSSGVRGVVLDTVVIGGSRCTTREAVERWIDRLTHGAKVSSDSRTPSQRQRDHDLADAALAKGGW